MTCVDCGCSHQECVGSKSSTDCPRCSLPECCCWSIIHRNLDDMSNSKQREKRLLNLTRKMGHGQNEDFKMASRRIRQILIRDFEREMALAEAFAEINALNEAAYHRTMSYAIHNTLRDLEVLIG